MAVSPRWLKACVWGAVAEAAMADLVALKAVHEHPRVVMTTAELAAALGVPEDEAATRITTLAMDGFLYGPMQVRSVAGVWSGIGFKLTTRARALLGVE